MLHYIYLAGADFLYLHLRSRSRRHHRHSCIHIHVRDDVRFRSYISGRGGDVRLHIHIHVRDCTS